VIGTYQSEHQTRCRKQYQQMTNIRFKKILKKCAQIHKKMKLCTDAAATKTTSSNEWDEAAISTD